MAITTATAWAKPESMLPLGVLRVRRQESQLSVWALRLSSCLTGGTSSSRPTGLTSTGSGSVSALLSKCTFEPQALLVSGARYQRGLPSPPGE